MTQWTVACQAPLFLGFPRQEYWKGLPFPSPADLPDPEIEPVSPVLAGKFFTTKPPAKPNYMLVVPVLSHVWLFETLWTTVQALSFTISQSSLRLMPIETMMPSNHLILCRPLLLLPSIYPSINQGLFQWGDSLHQVTEVLELQL